MDNKLDEILETLRVIKPQLDEFTKWRELEAEKQKVADEIEAESQKEFEKWVEERRKAEAQQEKDAEELQKHLYGGEEWKKERNLPRNF